MKAILLALGLMGVGFAECAAETGDGSGAGTSGGVVVEALTSSAEGANGIVFVMLPGHVSCPTISSVSASGEAFDVRGASLGAGVLVNLREGLADTGGGSHLLSEDAFFDDVDLGPFTVCAHLLDDAGACMHGCETASAFGNATPAHKAHVTLIMTCNTPPTQDVGAVVEVQNTPG